MSLAQNIASIKSKRHKYPPEMLLKITSCNKKKVWNIGAMFDPELSMSTQVKKLCRGAWIN